MTAGRFAFTIEQGATFERRLTWTADGVPVPLTGMTARMHVRAQLADPDPPLLLLTTENGRIALASPGVITLTVSAADTAALGWTTGVYDLEVVSPSRVVRLLEGTVSVHKEVTR